MDKERVYKIRVFGGKMKVEDFALSILTLVNYKSSVKETVIDVQTIEGTNNVIVCSYKDISSELKDMFNAEEVQVEPLNLYMVDWCDLDDKIGEEMEHLVYDKDEEVLIIQDR